MVVLHSQQRHGVALRALLGVGGGEIVRVHVAGDGRRLYVVERREVLYLPLPVVQRLGVFQVAHVLAGEGVRALGEAEGRLLLRSAGQEHMLHRHAHRIRHVPARAPQRVIAAVIYTYKRVVTLRDDLTVMQ